jgi:hypothetical protein
MSKTKKPNVVVSKKHHWPKPKPRIAGLSATVRRVNEAKRSKSGLWFVHSTIEEDDHRESHLGPLLEEPSEDDAKRLCLAYTGIPHDGSRPAYFDIEFKSVCKNVRDYAKKHGFLAAFDEPKDLSK